MDKKLQEHYIDLGLLPVNGLMWTRKAKDAIPTDTRICMSELIHFGGHDLDDREACVKRLESAGFSSDGYIVDCKGSDV